MMAQLWCTETSENILKKRIPNMQDWCWWGKGQICGNCNVLVYISKGEHKAGCRKGKFLDEVRLI
uniref:Uncharacterized protein n=1 Tax=Arundo donax TaxID=35708 RepID=A0A0A9H2V9_ARUDO